MAAIDEVQTDADKQSYADQGEQREDRDKSFERVRVLGILF